MDETRGLLQQVFVTVNQLTLAVSGTGSAGMEACVANLIEPGDEAIVCVAGVFGARMADVAERYGATVHLVSAEWGETLAPGAVAAALAAHPRAKVVGIVHAETSTGAHQPLEEISQIVHEAGALFVVDAVTSLGGHELRVDDWRIDACYSGTQKCLSCPPGLAPVTFSAAALEAMDRRKTKCRSWYLDMSLIRNYWSADRAYHHTAPVNMTYALREALRAVLEEGLESRIARHRRNHLALRAGLEAMGLSYVPEGQPRFAQRGLRAGGRRRRARAGALAGRVRDRDRRRPRPLQGEGLAHRSHGRLQHPTQRHPPPRRARDAPARRRRARLAGRGARGGRGPLRRQRQHRLNDRFGPRA